MTTTQERFLKMIERCVRTWWIDEAPLFDVTIDHSDLGAGTLRVYRREDFGSPLFALKFNFQTDYASFTLNGRVVERHQRVKYEDGLIVVLEDVKDAIARAVEIVKAKEAEAQR